MYHVSSGKDDLENTPYTDTIHTDKTCHECCVKPIKGVRYDEIDCGNSYCHMCKKLDKYREKKFYVINREYSTYR
jgi:hypothetical protein